MGTFTFGNDFDNKNNNFIKISKPILSHYLLLTMTSHNKHKPIYPSLMSKQTISSPFKPAQSPPTVSRKYQQLTPMPIPTFLLEKKLPQVPQTEREHQKNK